MISKQCWCGRPGDQFGVSGSDLAVYACYSDFPECERWYCRAHVPDVEYLVGGKPPWQPRPPRYREKKGLAKRGNLGAK